MPSVVLLGGQWDFLNNSVLMITYHILPLYRFAANLDDYHLVAWLRKERWEV